MQIDTFVASSGIACLILDTYSHVRRPHHVRMAELLA
jgi:hypothetical protein